MIPPVPPLFAIGIVSGIIAGIVWFAGAVADVAVAVAAALAAVWAAIGPILIELWHGVGWVWDDVVKPAWDALKGWGEEVWQLYEDHVRPIIDAIQGIVKDLRDVYRTFIQPFLDILSVLDQFLRLTGLANTVFGQWLDGEIHRVDSIVQQMWAELTRPINLLLHLVNEVILDARGILQAPLLLESTAQYMGYITQQWWSTSLTTIRTDWTHVLNAFHTGPGIGSSLSSGQQLVSSGDGPLADAQAHGVTVFQALASDDTNLFDYVVNGVGAPGEQL